jgi:uncharacterized protein YjiK
MGTEEEAIYKFGWSQSLIFSSIYTIYYLMAKLLECKNLHDYTNQKRFVFYNLLGIFLLSILVGCAVVPFPYQWIGDIDQVNFNEPSGIAFHPGRGTLFIVGDEGDVCEIQRDGTLVKQKRIFDADFEGITCNPLSGLLYIVIEGEEKIIEVDPKNFSVLREFLINRTYQGTVVLKPGGHGIEGIAFVPDSSHPEGGTFYITNQCLDLNDTENPSAIFELEVPLRRSSHGGNRAKIVKYLPFKTIDLSALHYDEKSSHLYVMSDATNTLLEITTEGKILKAYAFPGDNQEGIAADDKGFLYIAQDSGGIIKIKWNRKR